MTINSGVFSVRRMKVLGPTDTAIPLSSEVHEPVGPDLLGAEIITKTQFAGFDVHGSPIGADTQLVFCSELKTPIAIFNAFACPICRGYYSTFYMAQEIVPDPLSAGAKPSMRQGICKRCYDKGKTKRVVAATLRIVWVVLRFVFAPFLGSPSDATSSVNQPSQKPGLPAAGGTAVAVLLALGLLTAIGSGAAGVPGYDGVCSRVNEGGSMQPTPGPKEVIALIEEALLYGVDDVKLGTAGARCIRNLKAGIETGCIPEYDYQALLNLVGRAKRVILPMEWRCAFPKNPPAEIITPGDIHPVKLLDDTPVGLMFAEMAEALRSTGRPGSTKSTLSAAVLDASAASGKSIIVIDSKGDGQFDYLAAKHPGRILKVRVGRLNAPFFNVWQYLRAVRDYFLAIFSRKDSKIVLDAATEQSVKQVAISGALEVTHAQLMRNVASGATPAGFPFIPADFKRSMFSVFYDIAQSPLYPQIACQRGYELAEIVKRGYGVIIDSSSIAGTLQEEFLLCSLLTALRQEIKADPVLVAQGGTQVVFLVDECTYLAAASRVPTTALPSLVHLATLVRSSSICLFCTYHSIATVHPVLNAAATWFVTQISDGNDIATAKKTFALSDAQAKALTGLPKGAAMMRMGNRYTEPFLVTYPRLSDPKKMTDAEIDANNAPILATLSAIVPEDYRRIRPPVVTVSSSAAVAVPAAAVASATPPPVTAPPTPAVVPAVSPTLALSVTTDYEAILRDIAANPFMNVSTRAGQLALPSGKALTFKALKVALDDLNAQGFIGEVAVHLAPHAGSSSLMHYLTAEGHAAIGSLHKPPRGGYQHDLGQRLIKHILAERSIPATVEQVLPGTKKTVDVGFICPVTDLPIAIELPTSTFDSEPDQAERDLAAGWARVIQVCLNKADLESLIKAFARHSPNPDSRIKLCLISALKAASALPEIYDSNAFVVKVKVNKTKGSVI